MFDWMRAGLAALLLVAVSPAAADKTDPVDEVQQEQSYDDNWYDETTGEEENTIDESTEGVDEDTTLSEGEDSYDGETSTAESNSEWTDEDTDVDNNDMVDEGEFVEEGNDSPQQKE